MDETAAPAPRPIADIASYHAHIYYESATDRTRAARLRERVAERFAVQLGRWRDMPVGPHPIPMFQIAFTIEDAARLIPWLMLNRDGLTVLVHPNTDSPRDDHLVHALWLGRVLPLDGSDLPVSMAALGESHDPIRPNTVPTLAP